jgi:hypothetical protein
VSVQRENGHWALESGSWYCSVVDVVFNTEWLFSSITADCCCCCCCCCWQPVVVMGYGVEKAEEREKARMRGGPHHRKRIKKGASRRKNVQWSKR